MTNRTVHQIDAIIESIDSIWKLSVNENEFLDNVLSLILVRESDKAQKILDFYQSEEWDNLLEKIPDWDIQHYAERELDMSAEECEECKEKTLEDFDDYEILEEALSRDLTLYLPEKNDIVSEAQFSELTEVFEKLDFNEREKLLNSLR